MSKREETRIKPADFAQWGLNEIGQRLVPVDGDKCAARPQQLKTFAHDAQLVGLAEVFEHEARHDEIKRDVMRPHFVAQLRRLALNVAHAALAHKLRCASADATATAGR